MNSPSFWNQTTAALTQALGSGTAGRFLWASDFPHPDHVGNYIEEVGELAEKLPPAARTKVMGENVMHAYNCTQPLWSIATDTRSAARTQAAVGYP